ncbi:MAG: chemotaxis protein CheW [Leptospirales bacterium]
MSEKNEHNDSIENSFKKHFQALIFKDEDKYFGIDISLCQDVNEEIEIKSVPKSKKYIAGIINIRGEIITVIDLARLLKYKKNNVTNSSAVIRIKTENNTDAIRADSIKDIMKIPNDSLEDASSYLGEREVQFIDHVALIENNLILFPNIQKIFDSQEVSDLD